MMHLSDLVVHVKFVSGVVHTGRPHKISNNSFEIS